MRKSIILLCTTMLVLISIFTGCSSNNTTKDTTSEVKSSSDTETNSTYNQFCGIESSNIEDGKYTVDKKSVDVIYGPNDFTKEKIKINDIDTTIEDSLDAFLKSNWTMIDDNTNSTETILDRDLNRSDGIEPKTIYSTSLTTDDIKYPMGTYITYEVYNDTDTVKDLKDCTIKKVGISKGVDETISNLNIELPNGITFNSTIDDIVANFGSYCNKVVSDITNDTTYTWDRNDVTLTIKFDNKSNTITKFEYENYCPII